MKRCKPSVTPKRRRKLCAVCHGTGALLQDNDIHGLRIERCDACEQFCSDDEAVTVAYNTMLSYGVLVRRMIGEAE